MGFDALKNNVVSNVESNKCKMMKNVNKKYNKKHKTNRPTKNKENLRVSSNEVSRFNNV